jgi:uncharacterized lipoprotein YmbA
MIRRLSVPVLLSALLGLLAGCNLPEPQSDPVRHFTLSAATVGKPAPDPVTVRVVRLAGHLRGRAMAVRISENEVTYLEDVRWAEPLDDAITQLLRSRLRQVGGAATVTVFLQRCELVRNDGNQIELNATYTISAPGKPVRTGSFSAAPRAWDGKDYADVVAGIRGAVNELAEAVATAVGEG